VNTFSRTTAPTSKRGPRRALAGLLTVVALGAPAALGGFAAASAAPAPSKAAAPAGKKVIGMSAPSKHWNQRLTAVGSCGVEARRIFADLASNGRGQSKLIEQAVKAGMMPVISYKVPSVATLNAGGYDSWLKATRDYLTGLDTQVTATFWHEPHGNMSAAAFKAGSQRFLDKVKAPNVAVGPILNGWLLDNQVSTFASYTSPALLAAWDFVAVDSYQNGTAAAPGKLLPARAVPLLAEWMDKQGFPDKRIGLGEYNGFTGEAIRAAGDAILSTPEAWFGLAWNSSTKIHAPLTGDRLKGFQATKADPRALKRAGC
jgi:hypothetical protein